MKKIISLALSLSMLACMATNAFATTTTTSIVGAATTKNPVTQQDHVADSLDNGVGSFQPAGNQYNVPISVSANDTNHRYAVDVEYNVDPLSIAGSVMTWDVNTMTYKTTTSGDGGSAELTKEITIKNRSDLAVKAYATVALVNDYNDAPVTAASSNANAENALTVNKATAGVNTQHGEAASGKITISLTPTTNWDDVSTYLAGKGVASEVVIAVASLTIVPA